MVRTPEGKEYTAPLRQSKRICNKIVISSLAWKKLLVLNISAEFNFFALWLQR